MTAYPLLLSPAVLGDMAIPNRMLMSAMTRFRVTEDGTPTPLNTDYYSQRASAGLISTEAAYVEPRGRLTPRTAGLCTSDQIDAWRKVTSAVHQESGRIFVQLCHAGRISHPALQPDGGLPIDHHDVQRELECTAVAEQVCVGLDEAHCGVSKKQ